METWSEKQVVKIGPTADLKSRTEAVLADPDLFENIVAFVTNGGSLVTLCDSWGIRYSSVMSWLRSDAERGKAFDQALVDRNEWCSEVVLREIKRIGSVDVRRLFDGDGNLLPPAEWPEDVARAVVGMDVEERNERDGEDVTVTRLKKIKVSDKLKALEMLGKNLFLFTEKVEINHKLTLEELVNASQNLKPASVTTIEMAPVVSSPVVDLKKPE